MKFLLLFHGGNIPENKRQQSVVERLAWMNDLRSQDKFIDGSPLVPEGKYIKDNLYMDYEHDESSINGYAIIEAANIDEALELCKPAPQLKQEYGSANLEIRQLKPLN